MRDTDPVRETETARETTTVRETRPLSKGVVWALLALAALVVAIALVLGARAAAGEEEPFGGTDAAVTEQIEEDGHEPWFEPIIAPAGGEIESGLFALQAGLGGIVLGYAVGVLRERRRRGDGDVDGAGDMDRDG